MTGPRQPRICSHPINAHKPIYTTYTYTLHCITPHTCTRTLDRAVNYTEHYTKTQALNKIHLKPVYYKIPEVT